MILNPKFWNGKRVLLTGHTGFKGGWLSLWLQRLGAEVTGISLEPITSPNLFDLAQIKNGLASHISDIRDAHKLRQIVCAARPEVIFHLAAQPLVRASYLEPQQTFATNTIGTANLLDALRGLDSARVAIMITTDKVYQNNEWHYPYRETDTLGGHDPYSASKAASEIIISSYRDCYLKEQGVSVASARAGNVIGGGDWSEARLIPDAVRAWKAGKPLIIRRPQAIRPWQHVLEPLAGYLQLAQKIWFEPELAGAYNFGPNAQSNATVRQVVEIAQAKFGLGQTVFCEDTTGPHEAGLLSLETAKTREILGIQPKWQLEATIERTMNWYKSQQQGVSARNLCDVEITQYLF